MRITEDEAGSRRNDFAELCASSTSYSCHHLITLSGAFPHGMNDKSNEFRLQCYVQDLNKINVPQKPRRYVVITSLSLQKGLDACFLHSTHDMRPIPGEIKD